jgi:hypothetical protein
MTGNLSKWVAAGRPICVFGEAFMLNTLAQEAPVTSNGPVEKLKQAGIAPEAMRCPFVYSNDKQCCGTIVRGKAFGRTMTRYGEKIPPKKYRIWCSEKWDHTGAVGSWDAKERMEFYPDQLPKGMAEALEAAGLMEDSHR